MIVRLMSKLLALPLVAVVTLIQWVAIFMTSFSAILFDLLAGIIFMVTLAGLMFGVCLMEQLSQRLSKEDYELVKELRAQTAIAQCEESESHFKYGFSAGLIVQHEAYEQVNGEK